jgi:uncharacterized protein (DUF362 family)
VVTNNQLAATHADTIEGILEFLKSIKKLENAVIAESTAMGTATQGFQNYGYVRVAEKYNVKLLEIDEQPFDYVYVLDETTMRPRAVRASKLLLDGNDNFVISAGRMKTHDRAVITLSLKNVVLGAPIKAGGNDKMAVHGGGAYGINFNIFSLAPRLHPHLALVEGHVGMEGNGPIGGTPVDHKVCLAGMDWLAVDRVGAELMGVDYTRVGYLFYAAEAQLGQTDLAKIEILGEKIADHKKTYRLGSSVDQQFGWMNPPRRG